MESAHLSLQDVDFILESLKYTKLRFDDYQYHSYEYKLKRLNDVQQVMIKVSRLREALKKKNEK